jgi:hypothetical protein
MASNGVAAPETSRGPASAALPATTPDAISRGVKRLSSGWATADTRDLLKGTAVRLTIEPRMGPELP